MDTFPGTLYEENYPWIRFPEMKLYPVEENSIFRPVYGKVSPFYHSA